MINQQQVEKIQRISMKVPAGFLRQKRRRTKVTVPQNKKDHSKFIKNHQ